MINKTYYLENSHFYEVLENYIKENRRIAAGFDGTLKLYYITVL